MGGTQGNDAGRSDPHSFRQDAVYSEGSVNCQQRQQSTVSVVSETAGFLQDGKLLDRLYGKSSRVLVPIFVLCIVWNHIDRTNLAFAALSMNRDLGFDAATYGLGSALFFPTFCLFQVPSNLIMVRVGVRRWLSFLLFAWGCVASCFALVRDRSSFFVLRLLLGMFESGAAPAMWFHLSQFYPQERVVKPYSFMSMGILLANVLGAPLAAGFLAMDGIAGLQGWQWLFLLEGIPSVLLSVAVLIWVPEHLDTAPWFTDSERIIVKDDMAKAAEHSPPRELIPRNPFRLLGHAISNPLISYMCVVGFMLSTAAYTFIFFLPMIVEALIAGGALGAVPAGKAGRTGLLPVLLTSIPYTVGAVTTWVVAHSSQKRQELYWHCSLSLLFAGVFFSVFPVMSGASVAAGFVSLVMTVAGAAAANGPGITIVADISKGPSQVVGMPLYNSVSAVGGFVGPYMSGSILQQTGNFRMIAVIMGVLLFGCGVLIILLKPLATFRAKRLERPASSRTDPEQAGASGVPVPVQLSGAGDVNNKDTGRVGRESSTCVLVGGHVDSAATSAAVGRRAVVAPPPPLH